MISDRDWDSEYISQLVEEACKRAKERDEALAEVKTLKNELTRSRSEQSRLERLLGRTEREFLL